MSVTLISLLVNPFPKTFSAFNHPVELQYWTPASERELNEESNGSKKTSMRVQDSHHDKQPAISSSKTRLIRM